MERGLIVEKLSIPTIKAYLKKWGLGVERAKLPESGGLTRNVTVRAGEWLQPEVIIRPKAVPISGVLWQILTGKGLMAFTLTNDDSPKTVAKVADNLIPKLGKRKRTVITNHQALADMLGKELKGWRIEVSGDL